MPFLAIDIFHIIITTTSDIDEPLTGGAPSISGTRPAMTPGMGSDENFAKWGLKIENILDTDK